MIGLTSVTFRKYSIEQIVALAAGNGAECIEWGGDVHVTDIETARRARKLCDAAGIGICSYGSYFKIGISPVHNIEQVCAIAKELGTDTVRVWLGDKGSAQTSVEEAQKLIYDTVKCADIAARYGVTLAFEFHRNTFNDDGRIGNFIDKCNRENIKTYWQPFFDSEKRDIENIIAVAPHIANIHVFYWNAAGKRYLLEKGKVWEKYISVARENGFSGNYIMEFVKRDSKRAFIKDIASLREMLSV